MRPNEVTAFTVPGFIVNIILICYYLFNQYGKSGVVVEFLWNLNQVGEIEKYFCIMNSAPIQILDD